MITNEMVNRAIDYILRHIGEDIRVEDVAEYCHFSQYYFSRVFKAETGESIYAFIKRIKMEQSAFRLKVEKSRSITEIGQEYGYSSSNYSSVFRQHHNTSPVDFRRNIYRKSLEHPFFHRNTLETFEQCSQKITIEVLDDIKVIYERRIGNYHDLSRDWEDFLVRYKEYLTDKTQMLERTFDDPSITDSDTCLYDICLSVDSACDLENTCIIEGGKYAVYHYTGHVRQIYAAYQSMFNIWIPQSPYKIDERYGFDIYHSIDCETMYTVLDICIPVK